MQNMPQDRLKSAVYRSFVPCDDPKGVEEYKTIRRSKIEPEMMGNHQNAKQRAEEMVCKGSAEELNSASFVQLAEVSKGAQKLNRVIDSLSRGVGIERQSRYTAKDLLKGALDLQESLVMLGRLQEASDYIAKLKRRPRELDGLRIERTKSERVVAEKHRFDQMEFVEKRRYSVDGASRDCYEELREVIRESFERQNLLPTKDSVKRVSFESKELEPSRDFPSTSSSQSSFDKTSTLSSGISLRKAKDEKPKGPNLIAKLMGLEEISSKPLLSPLQKAVDKDRLFSQKKPIFEINLPKAKRAPPVVKKSKTLDEIIETMQLKGLLKSKFMDQRFYSDGSPPIVIMKPLYSHDLCAESFYTKEKDRKSRREEFLTDWDKGDFDTAFCRNMRAEKGAKEQGEPLENRNGKLSSAMAKGSDPGKPRQHKKEVIEKKLDKVQKAAPDSRKTQGVKNARVKDSAKSSAKLKKADTMPHISAKQVTRQKIGTSDRASKNVSVTVASHKSRNRKNVKTDKQVENKGDKDVQIDLLSNKKTDKTDNKVQEISDVYENHITDDQISDKTLPRDIDIQSRELESSWISPTSNENANTNSEVNSATRTLLLSSETFLNQAEELLDVDSYETLSPNPNCSQDGILETKLLVDCACELLNNKKLKSLVSCDPLSKNPMKRSKVVVSLDKLVYEICNEIESLRSYRDVAGTLTGETLHCLTRKDVWCEGGVSGLWDFGWSKHGVTSDEINNIVVDLEKQMLFDIIEDTVADFAF